MGSWEQLEEQAPTVPEQVGTYHQAVFLPAILSHANETILLKLFCNTY